MLIQTQKLLTAWEFAIFDNRPAFIRHQNDRLDPCIVFIVQPIRNIVLQVRLHVFVTAGQVFVHS